LRSMYLIYPLKTLNNLRPQWDLQPELQPRFRRVDPVFVWSARSLFDRAARMFV
jgi:hypothetical protein